MNKRAVLISVLALSSAYAEESAVAEMDVGEYGTIIDRQMFGPLPEAFDPAKPPGQGLAAIGGKDEVQLSKEKEEILKNVHFSVINLTPSGESVVGFTDNTNQKEPRHYYMKVGEIRDGWTVKAADASAETMTLVKDGIEVTMKLGDKSGKAALPPVANASAPSAAAAAVKADAATPSAPSVTGFLGRRGATLRARRREREAEVKRLEEARKKELASQRQELNLIKEELKREREARLMHESGKAGVKGNENNDAQ